jgi:hypothetical protein
MNIIVNLIRNGFYYAEQYFSNWGRSASTSYSSLGVKLGFGPGMKRDG